MPLRVWIYVNCGEVVLNKLVHVMTIKVNTCRQSLRTKILRDTFRGMPSNSSCQGKIAQDRVKRARKALLRTTAIGERDFIKLC